MKKQLLLGLALLAASGVANAEPITQDFNARPSDATATSVPTGWTYWSDRSVKSEWNASKGVDGTPCMKFAGNVSSAGNVTVQNCAYITQAYGGDNAYVSFMMKATSEYDVSTTMSGAAYKYVRVYKMANATDTPTNGTLLLDLNQANNWGDLGINQNDFTEVKLDLDEDCYIAIYGNTFYIDNYVNETGKSAEPEPTPGGYTPTSPIVYEFDTYGPAGYQSSKVYPEVLPEGWYMLPAGKSASSPYTDAYFQQNTRYGTADFAFSYAPTDFYLITKAYGKGTISIDVKSTGSFTRSPLLKLYAMKQNADGSFTVGEELTDLTTESSSYTTKTYDIEEDMWIGFNGANVVIDNYNNTFVAAGGGGGDVEVLKIEQTFNTPGPGGFNASKIADNMLPEGWYANVTNQYNMMYPSNIGVDDSGAIKIGNTAAKASYLITAAKGGENSTISFDAKWWGNSLYLPNPWPFVKLVKMTRNDDGTFTPGEELADLTNQMAPGVQNGNNVTYDTTVWKTLTYEGPAEDCYIGIYGYNIYIDNYVNTYTAAAGAPTYTVAGTVVCGDKKIAGATVALTGYPEVTTDENGAFTLEKIAADTYTLTVKAEGYVDYVQSDLEVTADITDMKIEIEEITSTLTAQIATYISASETGPVVEGATVKLFALDADNAETLIETVTTDAEGTFSFTITGTLNPYNYVIKASAPYCQESTAKVYSGYNDKWSRSLYFDFGKTKNYNTWSELQLKAKQLTFTANVTDTDGNPLADGVVTIAPKDNLAATTTATEKTDADGIKTGVYTISGINAKDAAALTYVATASVPGYKEATAEFQFDDNDASVNIALIAWKPTIFAGSVKNDENEAIEGAEVILKNAEGMQVGMKLTDADGNYSISLGGELTATYTLSVAADYYVAKDVTVENPEREATVTTDVVLDKEMYTLNVTVESADQGELSEVIVMVGNTELKANEEGIYTYDVWSYTAEDAMFTLQAVAEGYLPYSERIAIDEATVAKTITLEPVMFTFTGSVVDAEGNAIEGAELVVKAGEEAIELTENAGKFTFSVAQNACKGVEYTATASAPGYEDAEKTFKFDVDKEEFDLALTLTLEAKTYTYQINVVDAAQNAITAATVVVTAGEEATPVEVSGKDGVFTFTAKGNALPDYFTATVEAPEYTAKTVKIETDYEVIETIEEVILDKTESIANIVAEKNGVANIGGKLYVSGDARIFTVDGKLVKVVSNPAAEQVELPAGLYIVAGQKVLVK